MPAVTSLVGERRQRRRARGRQDGSGGSPWHQGVVGTPLTVSSQGTGVAGRVLQWAGVPSLLVRVFNSDDLEKLSFVEELQEDFSYTVTALEGPYR